MVAQIPGADGLSEARRDEQQTALNDAVLSV
jgi:hypothetical protein